MGRMLVVAFPLDGGDTGDDEEREAEETKAAFEAITQRAKELETHVEELLGKVSSHVEHLQSVAMQKLISGHARAHPRAHGEAPPMCECECECECEGGTAHV